MKIFGILAVLVLLHTLPLWDFNQNLAGGPGDPLAHAAIGGWYCQNVVTGNPVSDQFIAPFGVNLSGNYESPFPYILTCPFVGVSPIFQFHLFTMIQLLLIVLSGSLVARKFFKDPVLQFAYVLFIWWTGFYIAKSHEHTSLLSMIWGIQFTLYATLVSNFKSLKSMLLGGLLLGLSYSGTFQNIPALFLLTLGCLLYRLISEKAIADKISARNAVLGGVLALAIFLIAWLPMIQFHLGQAQAPYDLRNFREMYSLNWRDLFIPFKNHYFADLFKHQYLGTESTNTLDAVIVVSLVYFAVTKKIFQGVRAKVLLGISAIYFVLALGPGFLFNGPLFEIFPFYLTRVPSRFAAVGYTLILFLVFAQYDLLANLKLKKYLGWSLIAILLISGPALNQQWLYPTLEYQKYLPKVGLAAFAETPGNPIVVNVPAAWAGDQAQNFLQIFHKKRITAGYLAYPLYDLELVKKVMDGPFLGYLSCQGQQLQFKPNQFHQDFMLLKNYLVANDLTLFIFKKSILLGDPSCSELANWSKSFLTQPWIQVVEENDTFVLARIITK